ncbi:endonuclease/exonuclease/phosphatase family protein [Acuticoccus sp. MNP-M23]|uniref:endonuclease/exonuclease/phosphatase family protein n=1 Tax=Acuticoccus sp. MNP-M23 TaxID=3072793 RepID=UPI002815B2E0|nr:endonuclease/exonuclease/phosphatase family protein [Acuticoccus sp. MNP-M23]WMS42384.1 endonuclease/exonuclease/phosphatase family protein [Acuticoccus sp. MNP-M23]
MRLRVATYNVRKCVGLDWRRDPDRVLAVINMLDADIVVLQEADRRFGRRIATLSHSSLRDSGWYAVPLAPHDGGIGWHGNAVLVRNDMEAEAIHRVKLPALEPRGAVIVDLATASGPIRVVGAHLGLTRGMRVRQAHQIVEEVGAMAARPTVIMGDLNTWHQTGGSIAVLAGAYALVPPAPTFHASRPVAALDRIALSHDIALRAQGVMREGVAPVASDHLPLWADIEVVKGESR